MGHYGECCSRTLHRGGKARLGSVFPKVAVFKLGFKESTKTWRICPFCAQEERGRETLCGFSGGFVTDWFLSFIHSCIHLGHIFQAPVVRVVCGENLWANHP